MKVAFLYAGQGGQFPNVGLDLLDEYVIVKEIFVKANAILGYDLVEIIKDEKKINQTVYTQPVLVTLAYAISLLLEKKGITADVVAGLSLGEYNALINAGVLSFEDGLKIIKERAKIMDGALEKNTTSMAAVLKTDVELIEDVLASQDLNNEVAICNYNSYDQVVIGGTNDKLEKAKVLLKEAGVKRVIPLSVSTVSHMHLLSEAASELQTILNDYEFKKPQLPFINNVAAQYQESDFVASLTKQICCPTYMAKTIELMLNDGVDTFIEIGPKKTLSGFVKSVAKELAKEVKIYNVYDLETLNNFMMEMGDSRE